MVSVIIPAYNAERTIERAVRSVQNQSYKNLEIIIVNDASTDNTEKICRMLEVDEESVHVLNKKKNEGLSAARNSGLELASGEYVCFLDSDDEYNIYFVEKMLDALIKTNCDFSICGYQMIYPDNSFYFGCTDSDCKMISQDELIKGVIGGKISSHAWNKMYKAEFIRRFPYPVGKVYEDIFVFNEMILATERVTLVSYDGVRYYQNSTSIVHAQKNSNEIYAFYAFMQRYKILYEKYDYLEGDLLKNLIEIAIRIKLSYKKDPIEPRQIYDVISFLKNVKYKKNAYKKLNMKYKIALLIMG